MRRPEKKMGYYSAISTDFPRQLCFQNLGINSTENSSASQVYKAAGCLAKRGLD